MRKLSKIKEDAKFYDHFSGLIETCKTVALMEFRTLEKKVKTFEKFVTIVESFFKLIEAGHIQHPFVNPRGKSQGVIMVTSDAGLSGGLDMNIAATAISLLRTGRDKLVVVGRQGHNYAQENNISFVSFPGVKDEKRYSQSTELRDYVTDEVLKGRLGHIKVVYARPLSIIIQRVQTLNLLPCSEEVKGGSQSTSGTVPDIIMESTPEDLIEYLIYLWVGQKLFEVFGLSRLAEVAARFMHAEDSSQKIKEMNNRLRIEFVRARHEIIDQQMRELFAARAA